MPGLSDRPGGRPPAAEGWIEAARGGSRDAMGRALEPFRRYLLFVAEHSLPSQLRAEGGASDLVQETFLAAQCRFDRFPGRTERDLRKWLRTILKQKLTNLFRRRRPAVTAAPWDEPPADSTSPSDRAIRRERIDAMIRALGRIPERGRRIVLWRNRDGLTFEEIGRRLGVTAPAAYKAWTRALVHLERELGGGSTG